MHPVLWIEQIDLDLGGSVVWSIQGAIPFYTGDQCRALLTVPWYEYPALQQSIMMRYLHSTVYLDLYSCPCSYALLVGTINQQHALPPPFILPFPRIPPPIQHHHIRLPRINRIPHQILRFRRNPHHITLTTPGALSTVIALPGAVEKCPRG